MGGLRRKMPVTFWVYLMGALALAGIAPLAGFFSKDEILAAASQNGLLVFLVLLAAAFLTAFYMGRQLWLVFFGKPRSENAENARENTALIVLPLILLAGLTVLGGLLNFPGSLALEGWLEHTLGKGINGEFNSMVAGISLIVSITGLVTAWFVYSRYSGEIKKLDPLEDMFGAVFIGARNKWYVDELYHAIIVRPLEGLSQQLAQPVDQGLIDGIAVGFGSLTKAIAQSWRSIENGFVRSYALALLLGIVLIFSYLVIR